MMSTKKIREYQESSDPLPVVEGELVDETDTAYVKAAGEPVAERRSLAVYLGKFVGGIISVFLTGLQPRNSAHDKKGAPDNKYGGIGQRWRMGKRRARRRR